MEAATGALEGVSGVFFTCEIRERISEGYKISLDFWFKFSRGLAFSEAWLLLCRAKCRVRDDNFLSLPTQ